MPLRTVGKVGRILELFSVERPEWGVSEAAKELAMPKSGSHALMSSLADQGLLRRTREGRYRLGWRVTAMNQVLLGTTEFRSAARRAMEYLASRFGGESFYLAVLVGERVVFLDEIEGYRPGGTNHSRPGVLLASECAAGKVLLADLSWEEVSRIVADEEREWTVLETAVRLEGLRDELRAVREQGFALDPEETVHATFHAAAPIRDRTGEVVAAMGVVAPTHRFRLGKERYLTTLVEAARRVSESIGYSGAVRARRSRQRRVRLQKVC